MKHRSEGLDCKNAKNIDYFAHCTHNAVAKVKMELENEITIRQCALYPKISKIGRGLKILAKSGTQNCPVLCTPQKK